MLRSPPLAPAATPSSPSPSAFTMFDPALLSTMRRATFASTPVSPRDGFGTQSSSYSSNSFSSNGRQHSGYASSPPTPPPLSPPPSIMRPNGNTDNSPYRHASFVMGRLMPGHMDGWEEYSVLSSSDGTPILKGSVSTPNFAQLLEDNQPPLDVAPAPLMLDPRPGCEPVHILHPSNFVGPPELKHVIFQTFEAVVLGVKPKLSEDGMGGTYTYHDKTHKPCAVFKPMDEEPMAPHNPKGLSSSFGSPGIKRGILSGEAAIREVAAYRLDHANLARVPPTTLVEVPEGDWRRIEAGRGGRHKTGSLQVFVHSKCSTGDMGTSRFPAADVQRIALLDMRILNVDRHDGNILVQEDLCEDTGESLYSLVPIDHGFCLPDSLQVQSYEWAWFTWPQVREPIQPALRKYIAELNPTREADMLRRELGIRDACVNSFLVASTFVQLLCVRCPHLTLHDIGKLMCRENDEEPSFLERLVIRARWRAAFQIVRSHKSFGQTRPVRNKASAWVSQTVVSRLYQSLFREAFWKQLRRVVEHYCRVLNRRHKRRAAS